MNSITPEPIWLIEGRSLLLHSYFMLVMATGLILSVRGYRKERSIGYLLLALYFISPFVLWGVMKIVGPATPLVSTGTIVVKSYSRLAIPETLLVIGLALICRKKTEANQAPEPTPLRVTPAAVAPVAPRSVAAHL